MDFSLSYFSGGGSAGQEDAYANVFDGADFADASGLRAVWVPERHFQRFGGISPNPAVLGAALAVATRRIRIRAGSVVLTLHHPLRLVEEWSVVDCLSDGRIDLSFASGWHPADFILSSERYEDRRSVAVARMRDVRALWASGRGQFPGVDGAFKQVTVFPQPVQRHLPSWVTTSGSMATWELAALDGLNVLAAMIGESFQTLGRKIAFYKERYRAADGQNQKPHVTVMLHTFINDDAEVVAGTALEPLRRYIESYLDQKRDPSVQYKKAGGLDVVSMTLKQREDLVTVAMQRYLRGGSLIGTTADCLATLDRLDSIGVDEVACLVDFGIDRHIVKSNLINIDRLRRAREL